MDVLSTSGNLVTLSASKKDLARLGKLLDWIIDNKSVMDEGAILIPKEEIIPTVQVWSDFIDTAL